MGFGPEEFRDFCLRLKTQGYKYQGMKPCGKVSTFSMVKPPFQGGTFFLLSYIIWEKSLGE